MAGYLVTVESTLQVGALVQVHPRLRLKELVAREPDLMTPMLGDPLQLRMPDGSVRVAAVGMFGIEAWAGSDGLYTDSDPQDPMLTLSIAGDLRSEDVPAGTQVWLASPKYQARES